MQILDVCIIGFGISGIAMTRWAKQGNLSMLTIEREKTYGGVWHSKSYPGVILQTTKYSYSFSDMPMSEKTSLHPSHIEILAYLKSYITKHRLDKYVKYNTEVVSATKDAEGLYRITYRNRDTGGINSVYSRHLAICSGFYTTPKYINSLVKSQFKGKITHISEFSEKIQGNRDTPDLIKNSDFKDKRVLVIGNGPSGCDIACLAINNNAKDVSILYRSHKWIFPRYIGLLGLNFFSNRLFLWIATKLPINIFLSMLYVVFYIPYYMTGNKSNIKMPNKIVNRNNLTLNEQVVRYINNDKILYQQSTNIMLHDNQVTYYVDNVKHNRDIDWVIYATGYNVGIPFIKLDKIPDLYKRFLNPEDPNMVFIGFAPSFNWVQVSDLQARWFVKMIMGKIKKPSIGEMREKLNNELERFDKLPYEYYDLAYLSYIYCDDLSYELGIYPKTKKIFSHWWQVPKYNEWEGF